MSTNDSKAGELHTALATWIFLLHDAGHHPADDGLNAAIGALLSKDGGDADARGQALVEAVRAGLAADASADAVVDYLRELYGDDAITTDLGADRDDRIQRARRAQFKTNLPWLACIADRFPGGGLGTHWLLVERIDDHVTCMDPYPWDDLDEEYVQPLLDFMVKWELAGGDGVRWAG